MYFESYRTYQFIRLKCNLCKQPYGLLYILFESKIVANAWKWSEINKIDKASAVKSKDL